MTPDYLDALHKFEMMVKDKEYHMFYENDGITCTQTLTIVEPNQHLAYLVGRGKTPELAFIELTKKYILQEWRK